MDKAGDFRIELTSKNGANESNASKSITIPGKSAVVSYTDVEFALSAGSDTYGRLFSFETGKIYKDSEVTSDNGSSIHLAFGSMSNTMFYFESPTVADYKSAKCYQIKNY